MTELILVNERDEAIGTMEKMQAHREALLHRAFSVILRNSAGEILLQQRAFDKYHSGGLWTNTCCSHPAPGEDILAASKRRLIEELGIHCNDLKEVYHFIYKAELDNELTEHELDHVVVGTYDGEIIPNSEEVHAVAYVTSEELNRRITNEPEQFTVWFKAIYDKLHPEELL
jgi:isopentenyl-diphosphate delta-isomerase